MNHNSDALPRFQTLLRELFQFDAAELYFGIYRILNEKRAQIEQFIETRLPEIAAEAFAAYAAVDRAALEEDLTQIKQKICADLGEHAIDEQDQLKLFRESALGKQYLAKQAELAQLAVAAALKNRAYNDLYTFFARYYADGDFVTKRRYSYQEVYAIPYNGEEVMLHWANRDQYYVKTGERFKAYQFRLQDFTVAFALRNADTEQNNNRGEKRYFVFAGADADDAVHWDAATQTLAIYFVYRPLTDAEQEEYGSRKPQGKLNAAAEAAILPLVPDVTLRGLLARMSGEQSKLGTRLDDFTRRNSSDFFIHKNLRGFLRHQLDFYIKNEVLHLAALIEHGIVVAELETRRARLVRDLGYKIIDFVAQVEDFQKRLFEKKKFVLRTDYCLTLDRVPEALWGAVLANAAQIAEWRALYALDDLQAAAGMFGELDADFLRAHPTLVVDTRHFSAAFKWRLLAEFDDLDGAVDGVLLHSENFQALRLLQEKYRERIKCVYIDPPYNTGNDDFVYKDCYQHSSWLSMMVDRLAAARELMQEDGAIFVSIDDNEMANLKQVLDSIFGSENMITFMVWEGGLKNDSRFVSVSQDYTAIYVKNKEHLTKVGIHWRIHKKGIDEIYATVERLKEEMGVDYTRISEALKNWYKKLPKAHPAKAHRHYNTVDERGVFFPGDISWPGGGGPDYEILHPTTKKPVKKPANGWRYASIERMQEAIERGIIHFGSDENSVPNVKRYLRETEGRVMSSVFYKDRRAATKELRNILGGDFLQNPKDCEIISKMLDLVTNDEEFILDFFAGSGTTAHAVINLNRADGGKRKYLLVEMGDYFDTVLLPRIKKVVFRENWKDGKPADGAGVSHILKYHTLEQYEDTLNNLELPHRAAGQLLLKEFGDAYLLRYMLDFETQDSAALLDLAQIADPDAYKLKIYAGDEVDRAHPVDLIETFNYLLGIHVLKMRTYASYRAILGAQNGARIVIIWRKLHDLTDNEAALRADAQFITAHILPDLLGAGSKPDRLFVNGLCRVTGAEMIEPEFKRLMFR